MTPVLAERVETEVAAASLSIVVVNWNTKELLLQLLEDVLPWSHERDLEILIVDNASADGSVQAAKAAYPEADYPELRWLVQEENLGFAGGVNRGFAEASNDWILLLNTDVRCASTDIDRLCAFGDRAREVGILGPDVRNEDGSPQDCYWRFPSLWQLASSTLWLYKLFPRSDVFNGERYAGRRFEEPTDVDAVSGCVFLMRKALVDEVGVLDDGYFMYFEETDLCRRVRDAGWKVRFAPVSRFVHFLGGSSRLARKRNFLEFRRSLVRYHRKHSGPLAGVAARALVIAWLGLRLPIWGLRSVLPGERGQNARRTAGLHLSGIWDALTHRSAGF